MAEKTGISWTDHTFNPWWGCSKVSPACDHCYAERDAKRFAAGRVLWGVDAERRKFGDKHWKTPEQWNAAAQRDGVRRRVFCASMADVFDKNAPEGARERLFELIVATPWLDWLLLTKRIGNVPRMLVDAHMAYTRKHGKHWSESGGGVWDQLPDNAWLGATVVNQGEADRDIPKLLAVPARVRFLSIEPMLGPVDLTDIALRRGTGDEEHFDALRFDGDPEDEPDLGTATLDWIIAGGESGPRARPAHPDWFRSLRDQCAAAGVPFHFKQHGEWLPTAFCDDEAAMLPSKRTVYVKPDGSYVPLGEGVDFFHGAEETAWVGKAAAGRLLDGIEHNGFPT